MVADVGKYKIMFLACWEVRGRESLAALIGPVGGDSPAAQCHVNNITPRGELAELTGSGR